jgi:predicted RNase H-like HicB family nuclease
MLKVEQGNAGLWYVTSDVIPGLLVAGDTQKSALEQVGQALEDIRGAALTTSPEPDDRYSSAIVWSDEDQAYLASTPELPGCIADGRTKAEALRELADARAAWIGAANETNKAIPAPTTLDNFPQGIVDSPEPDAAVREALECVQKWIDDRMFMPDHYPKGTSFTPGPRMMEMFSKVKSGLVVLSRPAWRDISTAPKDEEVEVRGVRKLAGDGVIFTHWRPLSRKSGGADEGSACQSETLAALRTGACGCSKCIDARGHVAFHMVTCATCGNKRCPHAADHDLACTNSNEPGQPGSNYA